MAPVLACRVDAALPVQISTSWQQAPGTGFAGRAADGHEQRHRDRGNQVKQVVQPLAGGPVEVLDVPRPVPDATEVLVRTMASVISPGTERAVTALAQSSLLAKARARPDLVRQVVRKARAEGFAATPQAVRSRLAEDLPLGYSAAGVVLEVGAAVTGVRAGQLVATGGAGKANHAEFQAVPGPAVRGGAGRRDRRRTRRSPPSPRSRCTACGWPRWARARRSWSSGSAWSASWLPGWRWRPAATWPGSTRPSMRAAWRPAPACWRWTSPVRPRPDQVLSWSRGRGADAVLVCAAGRSSDAMMRVPALCRDRAAVVIVGDVGLQLDRTPFYERELSLRFARSYGPGRYDPSYEAWGVDYPAGQVRWTEGRNFEAVLDLLASGRLQVADLVTHTFDIAEATRPTS